MNAQANIETDVDAAPTTELTQQLAVVSKGLVEIDAISAGIADLRTKYGNVVYDVATTKGLDQARADRAAVRQPRYEVERIRKETKRPILDLGKKLDSEAARITDELMAIENPIHLQISNEETRKQREKEEKAAAERKRVEGIHARIDALRASVLDAAGKSGANIAAHIATVEGTLIDEAFAEFRQQAEGAKASTLVRLRMAHTAAVNLEAEAKRLQEVRERLDREKAEQDEAAAKERERIAKQQREQDAENARVKAAQDARDAEAAEQLRLQNEAAEREKARYTAALKKVTAIHDQLSVAIRGRDPDIAGGDVESFGHVIAETEAFEITEEVFGSLIESAKRTKEDTVATLKQRRAELVERLQREADAQKERERLAAERVENDRVAAERKADSDAEERRLADQRAALERDQADLRKQQEAAAAPAPAPAPEVPEPVVEPPTPAVVTASDTEFAFAKPARPSDATIVETLMHRFSVDRETVLDWLWDMDLTALAKGAVVEQSEAVTA